MAQRLHHTTRPMLLASSIFLPLEAEAQSGGGGMEEIVVTAERRAENLQKVPLAVSAFTAETLERSGVSSTDQLSAVTPGLQMVLQRNSLTPYLRGIGTQNGGPGEEGSIATYVDGVYFASLAGNVFNLNNIERIEVLRGPQGTLFGRNATGGLIHVITRDPSYTAGGEINVGYGNYDTVTGSFYGTTGISERVAVDLAVNYTDQGKGWGRNLTRNEYVNYRSDKMVRGRILWEPSDMTSVKLTGDYADIENDIGNTRNAIPGSLLLDGLSLTGSIYDSRGNAPRDVDAEQWGASLVFKQGFGEADFTSTTAYREYDLVTLLDQDGTPLRVVDARIRDQSRTFQQEFLMTGSWGRLDYTAGLFYYDARTYYTQPTRSSTASNNHDTSSTQRTKSYAGFLQGTYNFTDRTGLTLGVRYTRDKREIDGQRVSVVPHPLGNGAILFTTATLPRSQTHRTFNKLTWRAALEHEFSDDILGYVSASRGFKSGIFSATQPLNPAVNPETLDAYAIGAKTEFLDGLLRFNAEAFYYKYKQIQLAVTVLGGSFITNAAAGEVKGADIEAVIAPPIDNGHLTFSANLSVLDSRYTSFPNGSQFVPTPFTAPPGAVCGAAPAGPGGNRLCTVDLSGKDMIRAPKFTATFTADYRLPVANAGELGFNLTYYYNDGFSWEPEGRILQSAYNLLNAQIQFTTLDERWSFRVFGRNLTNERYYSSVSIGTAGDQAAPGAPRTYGVSLGYKFGGR